MSNISVDYDVLNQRGSPAWFTDTFANIPTAGFKGRMFISTDTFAFYRDTGTGWDLIGGPGTGTITGSGVLGQVSFFNGTQTLSGSNNLFWDNTNSRLGINTITPGQALDIHGTANTLVQLNNTTTANSNISFQNQNVAKWRVGNVYNGGANSFDIQNAVLSNTPISIDSASSITTFSTTTNMSALLQTQVGIYLNQGVQANALAPYTAISGYANGLFICPNSGTGYYLTFPTSSSYVYTFPASTGTIALTSNLSSYLPLAGGTLTGLTGISVAENNYLFDLINATENSFKLRFFNNGSLGGPRIVFKQAFLYQTTENAAINFYRGVFDYDGYMALSTAGVNRINISTGGFVGIGNANTTYQLDITGTLRVSSTATFSTGISVGNATPTTGGIQFPATQVAIADPNNLDDYEEGTFTPTLGGSATYISQFGNYTKIGNRVYFKIFMEVNVIGTGNQQTISGLPFTCDNTITGYAIYVGAFQGLSIVRTFMGGRVGGNTSDVALRSTAAAATGVAATNILTSGSTIEIGGFYGI